jgi:hypothetical protein
MTAATPNKMCLFVASSLKEGKLGTVDMLKMMRDDVPLDLKGLAQVEDCTCLLLADGSILPAVYFAKGRIWGITPQTETTALVLQEPIQNIQSWGPFLLAIGTTGALYLLKYRSGTGTFDKPVTFPMENVEGGAAAIGPNFVFGFVKEFDGLSLCVFPLDNANPMPMDDSEMKLPMLRVFAKIASGSDKALILAFDKSNKGKLYHMRGKKLAKVSAKLSSTRSQESYVTNSIFIGSGR